MSAPGLVVQLSTDNASTALASRTWNDITNYVQSFHIRRGKQRMLDRFESGSMDMTLKNLDRRFDPTNTSGPYSPNLAPLNAVRAGFVISGQTYWVYTGFVERWPQIWKGPTWAEVDITCVDAFEFLNNHSVSSTYAALAIPYGPYYEYDYTSVVLGYVGNSTTVAQVQSGLNTPLSVSVSGTDITVNLATNGAGAITSLWDDVTAAIAASTQASALVTSRRTIGTNTTASAFAKTNLSGGKFIQQLSGARVNAILDYIAWPAADRLIAAGTHQCQAQTIATTSNTTSTSFLQEVEQTEFGALFIDRNGKVVFLDQSTLGSSAYSATAATFTDRAGTNVGTFPYQDLQGDYDRDLIFNQIIANRVSSTTPQIVTDTISDSQYFTRSLSLSPLSVSDSDALSLAQAYLAKYKQPYFRFEPMKLFPGTNSSMWENLVQRELLDNVQIVRTPPGGGPLINKTGRIISIEISGSHQVANTVFSIQVDPSSGVTSLILDDSVYGTLDYNTLGF